MQRRLLKDFRQIFLGGRGGTKFHPTHEKITRFWPEPRHHSNDLLLTIYEFTAIIWYFFQLLQYKERAALKEIHFRIKIFSLFFEHWIAFIFPFKLAPLNTLIVTLYLLFSLEDAERKKIYIVKNRKKACSLVHIFW